MTKVFTSLIFTLSYLLSHGQGGQAFLSIPSNASQNIQARYLQVDVANNLSLNDAYSIEAWVNIPSNSDGYLFVIESIAPTAGFGGYNIGITNGKVSATVFGSSAQSGTGNTTISYDTWQHIAVTYDGSDEMKLYLNGTLDGTFNFGIDNYNFSTDLYIGANGNGNENTESMGIDEVRIWEDVRSAQEITDHMNTCLDGQESDLVLYYNFEQATGVGFVSDQGPLGNHATVIHEQTGAFVTGVFCCPIDTAVSVTNNVITANASTATYTWIDCDNGNAVIQGETNQSFTPTINGNYAVIVTDGACSDTSDCITINTTDLEELTPTSVTISPNPVKDQLKVISSFEVAHLTIIDPSGAIVQETKDSTINVSALTSGLYILLVETESGTIQKRFVKE